MSLVRLNSTIVSTTDCSPFPTGQKTCLNPLTSVIELNDPCQPTSNCKATGGKTGFNLRCTILQYYEVDKKIIYLHFTGFIQHVQHWQNWNSWASQVSSPTTNFTDQHQTCCSLLFTSLNSVSLHQCELSLMWGKVEASELLSWSQSSMLTH